MEERNSSRFRQCLELFFWKEHYAHSEPISAEYVTDALLTNQGQK